MDKRYLTCIILIILYVLNLLFEWLIYSRLDIFSLGMIVVVLIIMCLIYFIYKYKDKM